MRSEVLLRVVQAAFDGVGCCTSLYCNVPVDRSGRVIVGGQELTGRTLHRTGERGHEHPASAGADASLRHRLPPRLLSSRDFAACRRSVRPQCGCQRPPTPSRRPRFSNPHCRPSVRLYPSCLIPRKPASRCRSGTGPVGLRRQRVRYLGSGRRAPVPDGGWRCCPAAASAVEPMMIPTRRRDLRARPRA